MNKVVGVYSITNTVNGKRYIGSSVNIHKRWKNHLWQLNHNSHHSPSLQNSWKKRGGNAFKFEILLECDKMSRLAHEQELMDKYDSVRHGYNICPKAGSVEGTSPSSETRAKLSEAGRKRKQTPETRALLSALKKNVPLSEDHKAALRGKRGNLENVRLSKLGELNPNFGRPRSEETKRKIAAAQIGVPRKLHSEETKRKMRESYAKRLALKRGLPIPLR
jgi:group I intron endonuclease